MTPAALAAFRRTVGARHVTVERAELAAAERATFRTAQRVLAIVRPRDTAEVAACARIATERGVPLYPISGGKNWSYGSRVPPRDAVILDLARMNRIVEHAEDLAYVVVEPGVTFGALRAHLTARRSRLAPLSVGSSAAASVVGNILERGFGQGGYPDRAAHACGLEVVLPSGARIATGFGRFPGSPLANLHRTGLGPSLDGLFAQSNLGIVTRMAVWLRPAYPIAEQLHIAVEDPRRLPGVLDALRELRLAGVLRDGCALSSRARVLAVVQPYPWAAARGITPLPARVHAEVRRLGVARWMGWATLGYRDVAEQRAVRRSVRRALAARVDHLRFVPAGGAATPPDSNLPYWRRRAPKPANADPDRDGCGVLACGPVVPFRGRDVAAAVQLVDRTLGAHGFDPIVQLQCTAERTVIVNCMIVYDRTVDGEDRAARACYTALGGALAERGWFPYRSSILGMPSAPASEHDELVAAIKRLVDPAGILAPGRYEAASTPATGRWNRARP